MKYITENTQVLLVDSWFLVKKLTVRKEENKKTMTNDDKYKSISFYIRIGNFFGRHALIKP